MKYKKFDNQLHLPHLPIKISTSKSIKDTILNSRIRPYSSSKLNDLQKNLFLQLDQYDDIDKKNKKYHKNKNDTALNPSFKQFNLTTNDYDTNFLQKIQKVLPQSYLKILDAKKSSIYPERSTPKQKSLPNQDLAPHEKNTKQPKNRQFQSQQYNQIQIDEKQAEQIFQQFLSKEGLTVYNNLTSDNLKKLNQQISNTDAQINEIKKNMYETINILGNQCILMSDSYET